MVLKYVMSFMSPDGLKKHEGALYLTPPRDIHTHPNPTYSITVLHPYFKFNLNLIFTLKRHLSLHLADRLRGHKGRLHRNCSPRLCLHCQTTQHRHHHHVIIIVIIIDHYQLLSSLHGVVYNTVLSSQKLSSSSSLLSKATLPN